MFFVEIHIFYFLIYLLSLDFGLWATFTNTSSADELLLSFYFLVDLNYEVRPFDLCHVSVSSGSEEERAALLSSSTSSFSTPSMTLRFRWVSQFQHLVLVIAQVGTGIQYFSSPTWINTSHNLTTMPSGSIVSRISHSHRRFHQIVSPTIWILVQLTTRILHSAI